MSESDEDAEREGRAALAALIDDALPLLLDALLTEADALRVMRDFGDELRSWLEPLAFQVVLGIDADHGMTRDELAAVIAQRLAEAVRAGMAN